MITVKQEVNIFSPGRESCNHAFVNNGIGKLSLKNLSFTQEKICFNCGRYEETVTKIVKENPFSFNAVKSRFGVNI